MMRTNEKPSKHHMTTSSFRAPSRDANNQYDSNYQQQQHHFGSINRSRSNFGEICDETWPLDEVINKIELKSDSDDESGINQPYNVESNIWRSGPQLVSHNFDSGRDIKRLPGNGAMFSSWNQGSKTWKDKSVQHRKYKVKKNPSTTSSLEKSGSLSYDANNNYLDMDITYDDELNFSDDYSSTLLRDVGIQCNLKKYQNFDFFKNESPAPVVKNKPPIKIIKSSNNGIVSTFSDVPKLSSPSPTPNSPDFRRDLDLDQSSSIRSTDVIYSQIDKSHKSNRNINNPSGNINIVYKQPLNESKQQQTSTFDDSSTYDIKTKEFGFNVNNPNFRKIPLPNPNENLWSGSSIKKPKNQYDKEVLEETISISNSSTDESYIHNNHSMKSSNRKNDSPMRQSYNEDDNHSFSKLRKMKKNNLIIHHNKNDENNENVLLENNSLRLKSSKSPYSERLHKSNADLREQFLKDETRGGLAAAYKNRQQQKNHQQNRHRTLSLNRMNAVISDEGRQQQQQNPQHPSVKPNRHLSQSHLSSRYSDLGVENHHPPRSLSSSRSRSIQHERDPIVMYIPPVNPQIINESPKLTSILRNNSTKSNVTVQSKAKKLKQPQLKSQSKINLKDAVVVGENGKKNNNEKRADLNRRYSMPKDTKFNWLSKFKLKK
ncbi:hypothetical protein HUG17_1982 [Dermatophagoides farinae]|uniref:Uncharacterized protein n=1 Tax=Dermatophagoides farinae TaxID=6954 RepID=A0A9D4PAG7_DERFA|nr:GATA zinc finger domain-containing protein 14-like [Dermatophagoides farinae]XP_046919397.1 GATA zinc finger domain-containing protein 14-like [Dermatophagoides farinae]KAH7646444.1 hypothetical protein HUG17_1982 [Dermatophagoides farinae]